METTTTPAHLLPSACYVCGHAEHEDTTLHRYWSNAAALAEAREHDAKVRLARTPEAAYVAEHRPY